MNRRIKLRGSVMVEFVIILPLLLMLLFAITELGRALYQLNMLSKAATTAGRYLARVNDALIYDIAETPPVCRESVNWADGVDKARNIVLYGSETAGTEVLLPDMTADSVNIEAKTRNINVDGAVTGDCVISIEVSAEFVSLFGERIYPRFIFVSGNGNGEPLTLTQKVEERYIGE